ncbi:MAG: zinc-binding dehydrogenase [Spirochaetes bacterium]|nr:zinc-binding dehydrogenase [Spirochaetota bacterium]
MANLQFLSEMIMNNKLKTVIDKRYSMDDIVEAHNYVETGHKKGNVVLCV